MSDEFLSTLRTWHANCNPDMSVPDFKEGGADWYVPFDNWQDPENGQVFRLRGPSAADRIVNHIRLQSGDLGAYSAQLFSGFRGSGKSTELRRVQRRLSTEYSVLLVRAEQYHHMSDALTPEELALVLAGAIGEAAAESLDIAVLKKTSIWQRISDFLTQEAHAEEILVKGGPLQFKFRLKQGGEFRDKLAQTLGTKPELLRNFLHSLVTEVATAIKPRPLVILVDGLEKFYAPVERIPAIYQAMADLFFHQADLLQLPDCHVVYTVPPYLAFLNPGVADRYGGRLRLLASVMVHERPPERLRFAPGIHALECLVSRRIDLDRLFGERRADCMTALCATSGGHVRDLLHLLQEVIGMTLDAGATPVGLELVQGAIRNYRNSRHVLFADLRILLQHVASSGSLEALERKQLGELTAAMDQYLVLHYHNDGPWYDVHPLILDQLSRGIR